MTVVYQELHLHQELYHMPDLWILQITKDYIIPEDQVKSSIIKGGYMDIAFQIFISLSTAKPSFLEAKLYGLLTWVQSQIMRATQDKGPATCKQKY